MDNGHGSFVQGERADLLEKFAPDLKEGKPQGLFSIGEIIEIRGSKFKIKNIKPKELRLKLLPKITEV